MPQEKTLKLFKNAEGLPEGWKVASFLCELEERLHTLTLNLLELNIPYPLNCNIVPYFWDLYIYFEGATPE